MHSYKLFTFRHDGAQEFAVQIRAEDDAGALERARALPLGERFWELYRADRLVFATDPATAAA